MARPKKPQHRPDRNLAEARMTRSLDDLARYETFTTEIAPALREDLKNGLKAEEIYEKYTAHAAARGISIAMTERDTGKAMKAIQDVLDRTKGKAIVRTENKHRFEELTEEQLDAIVMSKLRDVTPQEEDQDD